MYNICNLLWIKVSNQLQVRVKPREENTEIKKTHLVKNSHWYNITTSEDKMWFSQRINLHFLEDGCVTFPKTCLLYMFKEKLIKQLNFRWFPDETPSYNKSNVLLILSYNSCYIQLIGNEILLYISVFNSGNIFNKQWEWVNIFDKQKEWNPSNSTKWTSKN